MTLAYDVLRELRCATAKEVATRLGVTYSTARTYLERLVEKGLAEKRWVGRIAVYCAKDVDVSPRGAYKLYTETRRRMVQVLNVLERDGCVSVSGLMRALHISHTEAYHLVRVSLLTRRGVKMVVGNTAILCRDRDAAEETVSRIMETIHRLAVENGMRYVTTPRILQAVLKNRDAYELLSRFVPLRRNAERFPPVVLTFVSAVLELLYGEPLRRRGRRVYAVTPQPRGRMPDVADGADKHVVRVNLPDDLAESITAVKDVDSLVLQAIEQLLARFRT